MEIDFSNFIQVCKEACKDDNVFLRFKEHLRLRTPQIEHGISIYGHIYIQEMLPEIRNNINLFSTNDSIGCPVIYYYPEINEYISVRTLFYTKVLSDLIKYFGPLNAMDIVDIGCGYGGQCKIMYDYYEPNSYTLIDLPEPLALARKYVKYFGIDTRIHETGEYDLCISNYAFTELSREQQEEYNKTIIQKSDRGYMTCNFFDLRKEDGSMTKEEILSLRPGAKEVPEIPLTAPDNCIIIWGHDNI